MSRHVHIPTNAKPIKSIHLSGSQAHACERIRVPDSWIGQIAEQESIEYWENGMRELLGESQSSRYISQRQTPLILEIDKRPGQKTILSPQGIRFGPTDPLGERLWSLANPTESSTSWSERSRWVRWPVYYFGCIFLVFCFGRERVPIVGVSRFNCIPDSWSERAMQKDLDDRDKQLNVLDSNLVPRDDSTLLRARSVLNRIVRASGLDNMDWDLQIFLAPEIENATVTASGQVILLSGILNVAKSDDELAAVLSHEIAHIVAHHSAQDASLSAVMVALLPPLAPCAIICGLGMLLGSIEMLLCGLPMVGVSAAYYASSRNRESEADYIGLILMADAGFDPRAAARLWGKLNALEERRLLEFKRQHPELKDVIRPVPHYLSTHPHSASRISETEKWAPEVLQITGQSKTVPIMSAWRKRGIEAKKRKWDDFVTQRDERRIRE